jgi:hypothetical protein
LVSYILQTCFSGYVYKEYTLGEYYEKKLREGKHPQEAIGACARKLTHLIYYILKEQKPFDPNYRWAEGQSKIP